MKAIEQAVPSTARREATGRVRVADAMVSHLREIGVRAVFGIPGAPIAPIHDALLDARDVASIHVHHESAAVFAAAVHGQLTATPGIALVTSGPGVMNAMSGLASARQDGLPLVLLVGEVPRRLQGKHGLQDGSEHGLRVLDMLRPHCKHVHQATTPGRVIPLLHHALDVAAAPPFGPTAIVLPMDVLLAPLPTTTRVVFGTETLATVEPDVVAELLTLIVRHRQSGALFVGSGMRHRGGPEHLRELAESLAWPVVTTPKAKGVFPESHALSAGVCGLGGHVSARELVSRGVDLLVVLASSLGETATGFDASLGGREASVQVDIDPSRIGHHHAPTHFVQADAPALVQALAAQVEPHHTGASYEVRGGHEPQSRGEGVSPIVALRAIQLVMPRDTVFLVDAGEHTRFAIHYMRVDRPDGFVAQLGLGSMGASLGGALGAKAALPDRPVAVVCGDGGFAMLGAEVATAAREGWPIAYFVFNDQRLGMVEVGHDALFGRTPAFATGPIDISVVARGFGAEVQIVATAADLKTLSAPVYRPTVFDIRIDRAVSMPPLERLTTFPTEGHAP